jgi:hypothetical protein
MDVTDRLIQGLQGAIKGPAEGHQGATQGPSEGHQGATNKKSRREEIPRNQEDNNNNNAADAGGAGVVLPPAEVPGAIAPGGEEEAPPAPVGEMPGAYVEMTPGQKASKLAMELPLYVKCVAKLNQRPTFTASTLEGAIEWFQRNTDHEWFDIQAICALGIKNAREYAAPEEGFDPYFWSRKYAHKPNKLFETNADGDMILALILGEGKWAPDAEHDAEWASQLTEDEVRLALGKRK